MELLSVIYNSLMIVFALLSLVIFTSLICSKFNFCGEKKRSHTKGINNQEYAKVRTSAFVKNHSNRVINNSESISKHINAHDVFPSINKELIENKKVRVVSRREIHEDLTRDSQYHVPSATRFTVVNTLVRETPREKMFPKYTSMSIKYSQIA